MQKTYMTLKTDDKYLEHNIVSPLFSMAMGTAGVKIPFSAQNQSILVDSIKI